MNEGLLERLRSKRVIQVPEQGWSRPVTVPRNPDGDEAATEIERLSLLVEEAFKEGLEVGYACGRAGEVPDIRAWDCSDAHTVRTNPCTPSPPKV